MPDIYTHSSTQCFKTCRRQYWYRYEVGLRPIEDSRALRIGTAVHELLNGFDVTADLDPFDAETVRALVEGHRTQYASDRLITQTIDCEVEFAEPISPRLKGAVQCGKIDAVVRLADGREAILERKTTSDAIDTPKYWNRLLMDPQISGYLSAIKKTRPHIDSIVYDVIRKPAMQPALATPEDKRKYTKATKTEPSRLYANMRETDETPEEWGKRLRADIAERPDFYYARREIARLEKDLEEDRLNFYETVCDIRHAKRTGHWGKHVSRYTCDFCPLFDVCVGFVPFDGVHAPPGFEIVENRHPELGELNASRNNAAATDGTLATA